MLGLHVEQLCSLHSVRNIIRVTRKKDEMVGASNAANEISNAW